MKICHAGVAKLPSAHKCRTPIQYQLILWGSYFRRLTTCAPNLQDANRSLFENAAFESGGGTAGFLVGVNIVNFSQWYLIKFAPRSH